MHLYICTSIHIYIYTYIHIYIYTYNTYNTYIHIYIYAYWHIYIFSYLHIYVHIHIGWLAPLHPISFFLHPEQDHVAFPVLYSILGPRGQHSSFDCIPSSGRSASLFCFCWSFCPRFQRNAAAVYSVPNADICPLCSCPPRVSGR